MCAGVDDFQDIVQWERQDWNVVNSGCKKNGASSSAFACVDIEYIKKYTQEVINSAWLWEGGWAGEDCLSHSKPVCTEWIFGTVAIVADDGPVGNFFPYTILTLGLFKDIYECGRVT